jgi:hypothetical protein
MSVEELRQGFYALAERLYSEDFTRWRRAEFSKHYLSARRRKRREFMPS